MTHGLVTYWRVRSIARFKTIAWGLSKVFLPNGPSRDDQAARAVRLRDPEDRRANPSLANHECRTSAARGKSLRLSAAARGPGKMLKTTFMPCCSRLNSWRHVPAEMSYSAMCVGFFSMRLRSV